MLDGLGQPLGTFSFLKNADRDTSNAAEMRKVVLLVFLIIVFSGVTQFQNATAGGAMIADGEKNKRKTLVIIGASYAKGLSQHELAECQVVNKGVNGEQSFEMLARFEADVVALKPDAVLIWGFINDIFRGDAAHIDQIVKRIRESIMAMVTMAKKAGITPIVATEVTIRGKDGFKEILGELVAGVLGKSSYQDYVNKHVREINQWIREMAAQERIQLLDFEAVLADPRGVRKKEFSKPDGSHISEAGYEALTRYVEERLKVMPSP
jgi:lysophospholipase L1-like esterase